MKQAVASITAAPPMSEMLSLAEQIAEIILERIGYSPICSVEYLVKRGFEPAQLAGCWQEAWKIVERKRRRPFYEHDIDGENYA